ncbi:MAG: hypothetical protein K2L02_01890 [Clostridia bacterium]|nr:hypothetical protein [Clostridia bacterium]
MKKKALFTVLTASLMCAAAAITFAACGETKTYSVTYVKSTLNETGSVPTDSTKYEEGKEVTVKGQGDLALENYTFSGWDYNGKTYAEGEKITMPAKDITLTAKWTQIPDTTYTVTFVSNVEGITLDCNPIVGHAGDKIDLEEISEAINFGSLNPENYVFSHLADNEHRYYDGSEDLTIPAHDVTYTAYFREIVKAESVTLTATNGTSEVTGDVDSFGCWYKAYTINDLAAGAYTVMVVGDDLAVHADDDPDGPQADSSSPLVVSCEGTSLTLYIMGAQSFMPEFTSYNTETGEVEGTKETDSISGTVILLKGASHTITFRENPNDGRPGAGIKYVVEAGEKLSATPAAPASTATSISEGWYIDDTPFDLNADIESDLTVVAKITKVTYSNGLFGDGSEEKPVLAADLGQKNSDNSYTITLGGKDTFTRDQYTLIGWTVNGMPYNLGDSCDIEAGSNVGITAVWKLNANAKIEIEDITVGDYATSGTTPQYVYPEQIEPGQKVTVTGKLKNTTTVLATDEVEINADTHEKATNMHRFSGVKVMLSDDGYVGTYYAPESYAYAYYDWQANVKGSTFTTGDTGNFKPIGVRFDGTDDGWFENFCALMTELQTNAGSFKAEIDYTNGAYVYITYTITANFAIGGAAAADHTFLMQYRVSAGLEGYWIALAGETAELTDITIARLCPHNDLGEDNVCAGCGATFAYTPVFDTSFTSTTEVIYNGYAVPEKLTKGKEIIIYGTQTGDINANWDSLYWEFSEGYTGRSDCYGWTFGDAKLGANIAGDDAGTNTNILYKHFFIMDADGNFSDDWAKYKAIATNCEFGLRAAWVEEGFISVSLMLMSDTAGIYQVDYRLAITDNTVEEFNLHIGGGFTTTTVTAYATITHPAN